MFQLYQKEVQIMSKIEKVFWGFAIFIGIIGFTWDTVYTKPFIGVITMEHLSGFCIYMNIQNFMETFYD